MSTSNRPLSVGRATLLACPDSMRPHAEAVLRGEYALPRGYELQDPQTLVVVDVGANIGAFAVWAATVWPGCRVHCFEPVPDNARLLRQNAPGATVVEAAVLGEAVGKTPIHLGRHNCGEASRHDLGEQDTARTIMVDSVAAASLPPCDALKIDTEGDELEILSAYPHLRGVTVVMLEWHRPGDRWAIGALLTLAGMECVRDDVRRRDRGAQVWVR